jgi:hypothetical protein
MLLRALLGTKLPPALFNLSALHFKIDPIDLTLKSSLPDLLQELPTNCWALRERRLHRVGFPQLAFLGH